MHVLMCMIVQEVAGMCLCGEVGGCEGQKLISKYALFQECRIHLRKVSPFSVELVVTLLKAPAIKHTPCCSVCVVVEHLCYPSSFVCKHSCPGRPRPYREEQRPKTTLTLPYISNLSEAIRRVLTPLDIQGVFCPLMTLRQLYWFTSKTEFQWMAVQ